MRIRFIVAGLTIALLLAVAASAGAQTPPPPPTGAPPSLPTGCVVTSAGLQCPQLPAGCLVTSAGLQCPPGSGVESETAASTPTPTPVPARPRRKVLPAHDRGRVAPPAVPTAATAGARPPVLPFTGGEPLLLAALGGTLVGAGLALRRRRASS